MGKKQIRAANRTAKPHEIRLPRTRISNHKPRKGTETKQSQECFIVRFLGISNHKPRKGTETLALEQDVSFSFDKFQTTNPARGRKRRLALVLGEPSHKFQTTNPARGRKLSPVSSIATVSRLFQTTNPARGRKQDVVLDHLHALSCISNHKPRKGTETPRKTTRTTLTLGQYSTQKTQVVFLLS